MRCLDASCRAYHVYRVLSDITWSGRRRMRDPDVCAPSQRFKFKVGGTTRNDRFLRCSGCHFHSDFVGAGIAINGRLQVS